MILLFIRQPAGVIYQNGEVLDIGNELITASDSYISRKRERRQSVTGKQENRKPSLRQSSELSSKKSKLPPCVTWGNPPRHRKCK